MVMVTRSSYRRACESSESSDKSQRNIVPPPWCSLSKVPDRRKSRRAPTEWERRSVSPPRKNICEYLHEDNGKLYKRKQRACCKQTLARNKGRGKTLISLAFLLLMSGIITILFMPNSIPDTSVMSEMTKVIPRTNLISFLGLDQSVEEECCSRMKYLMSELLRAEQALRTTHRMRRTMLLASKTTERLDSSKGRYIEGVAVTRGKDTKDMTRKIALIWGIVPLSRASPPPDTVLSRKRPVPSDCWPFSGSQGELMFELPRSSGVQCISVEHVYPDAASSAPKNFMLYGVLANGTWLKQVDGEYKRRGPARQYFPLLYQNTPVKQLVFRVLSNQGNPQYTCVYRVHLYENKDEL